MVATKSDGCIEKLAAQLRQQAAAVLLVKLPADQFLAGCHSR